MIAVRDRLERFGDATVGVVTFAEPARLAAYREHLGLPASVALVSDPDRSLYRLVGAERGSHREVWSAGTVRMYVRLLRAGRRLRRPTEDLRQLGADVVVGRDGRVRLLSLPRSPDARTSVSELIAAID